MLDSQKTQKFFRSTQRAEGDLGRPFHLEEMEFWSTGCLPIVQGMEIHLAPSTGSAQAPMSALTEENG